MQYNSGGHDSYDWSSTMRLHTGPGGGAVFALSDPVATTPGATHIVESRMRFYVDPGDACFFTVLQYDRTGKQVAENETVGFRDHSHWSWQPMRVLLYTVPDAVSLRYRFGLISAAEKSLDVDALQ